MNLQSTEAILVLPCLNIQNANAISSPLTHGFPSVTAFVGLMWALERQLAKAEIPLSLQSVGVICHRHQEQVTQSYVRTFNLTRNPIDKDGSTAAIVEEGRMHMQITLVFAVAEKPTPGRPAALVQGNRTQLGDWARQAGHLVAGMRIAGGSVLPTAPVPGRRTKPWIAVVPEDPMAAAVEFRKWRRQWLPGFALVGRDDLLARRLNDLQKNEPRATLLDAWLDAARFNYRACLPEDGTEPKDGSVEWKDTDRQPGSGWVVPIPVGYVALTEQINESGTVRNTRDPSVPLQFVESVYSLGEWVSPHRLNNLNDLLWYPETCNSKGLYRCTSGYQLKPREFDGSQTAFGAEEPDDSEVYDYT